VRGDFLGYDKCQDTRDVDFKIQMFRFWQHKKIPKSKHLNKYIYRVRPKKRRKQYLRYLWLDLNKTKTRINYFKDTISIT
jgi:hypothetical protein